MSAGWRALLWSTATIVVVVWAFQAGVESYDREHCGSGATDCDLGVLRGGPWAGLALLGMALLITGIELWLARRRRKSRAVVGGEGREEAPV